MTLTSYAWTSRAKHPTVARHWSLTGFNVKLLWARDCWVFQFLNGTRSGAKRRARDRNCQSLRGLLRISANIQIDG